VIELPRPADDRLVEAVRLAVREELAALAPTQRPVAVAEETVEYAPPQPSPWSILIRLGRTAQGMTEGELANYVGQADRRTVQRWEAGKGEPSLIQRTRLIALFAGRAEAPATAQRRRRTA
jgi:DNA-binding XRE family transcriptional regulator